MSSDWLLDLVKHGREERNLELKSSMAWTDPDVRGKVCRTLMALSNIRDGGALVLGVVEGPSGTFTESGMQSAHSDTFTQDGVAAVVAEYAAPFVDFTLSIIEDEGKDFVVFEVREFAEVPIVCRKDGLNSLRRGALYTRTRRMYESAECSSEADTREIWDLAVDKGVRQFIGRAEAVGMAPGPGDVAEFENERGDL